MDERVDNTWRLGNAFYLATALIRIRRTFLSILQKARRRCGFGSRQHWVGSTKEKQKIGPEPDLQKKQGCKHLP